MEIINHAFGNYDSNLTSLFRKRLLEITAVSLIMILFGIQFYHFNQISFWSFIAGLLLVGISIAIMRKTICIDIQRYKASHIDFKKVNREIRSDFIGSLIFSVIAPLFFFFFPVSFFIVIGFLAFLYGIALKLSDIFYLSEH